jgi:dTDP-D-glucose 4,6-dehydratase
VGIQLNKPIAVKYEPATIYDTNFTKANVERINKDTGWKATMDFDMGLTKQIGWQKDENIQ